MHPICQNVVVVSYSRVSTDHHEQRPEIQVEEIRRYCKARGWSVSEEIIDHGYSGGTDNRPGLKRLLDLARKRRINTVVVLKMDRLFRSLRHLVNTLEEFDALGIQFISITDNIDYTTPMGRFFVQLMGSLGEFEKSLLRERTLLGLKHARERGKSLGRPKKRDDAAIMQLRAAGLSYTQIQKKLGVSRGAVYRALRPISKTSNLVKQFLELNQVPNSD